MYDDYLIIDMIGYFLSFLYGSSKLKKSFNMQIEISILSIFLVLIRCLEWGLLAWALNNIGRSIHSRRSGWLVQRGSYQKRPIWLRRIHSDPQARRQGSWWQMNSKHEKHSFVICASRFEEYFFIFINPNSDFGFLFLRLILFYLYIILCMQSTWTILYF